MGWQLNQYCWGSLGWERKRGTAVRQMWSLDGCQAASRHPAADPSSQYERGREREMWKTAGSGRRKRGTWIDFVQRPHDYSPIWEHPPRLLASLHRDCRAAVPADVSKEKKTNWIWNNLLCKHLGERSTLTGLLFFDILVESRTGPLSLP